MRKKSFLSFIIMLLFVTTSCNSDEPAITKPEGSLSNDARKTIVDMFLTNFQLSFINSRLAE